MIGGRLVSLGLDDEWRKRLAAIGLDLGSVGRVCAEHRDRWLVATESEEVPAMLAGRLRLEVEEGTAPRPVVGDWVQLRAGDEAASQRLVTRVVPRRTWIERKAPGRTVSAQTLAANVDLAFLVAALGAEVNERRIERFATILGEGGVRMVVVLNKADLVDDIAPHLERARRAAPAASIHAVSALTGAGLDELDRYLARHTTVAVLGISGAGKSTLVNRWLGDELQRTTEVRSDQKGRHTTTTRELLALPSGCLVLDTPGLREVGVWDGDEGLDDAFPEVAEVATRCRFGDCRHDGEPGCAVAAALASGELAPARVNAWRFLLREQQRIAERTNRGGAAKREASKRERSMALRKHLVAKGKK